jgi:hypothetical protein
MVVRLVDLPAGFGRESGTYVSNAQSAKASATPSLSVLIRWGRINGYDAKYSRSGIIGLITVESVSSTYKSSSGAAVSLHDSFHAAATASVKFKPLSTGGPIGSESRLYTATVPVGGVTVITYAVLWRYRTVKATLLAAGVGLVNIDSMVDLAQTQQRYIEAALD